MVVHPLSHGIPRAPRYSGSSSLFSVFGYGAFTLSGRPSHALLLTYRHFSLSLPRTLHALRTLRFNFLCSIFNCSYSSALRTLLLLIVHCSLRPTHRVERSVWHLPRSLATTCGISVDFFSSPYLDVSVRAVPHVHLFYSMYVDRVWLCRVSPFGNPRI